MNEIPLINYDGMPHTRGFWSGDLPHWDVYSRPIFITLHVKGAIPREAANEIRENIALWRSSVVAHVGPTCAFEDAEVGPTSATKNEDAESASTDTEYTRRLKVVFKNMERWLDRADHPPLLTHKGVSEMIRDAIEQRERRDWWRVLHWTLMPSHLHILYVGGQIGMQEVMTDFKRWTGRRATAILGHRSQRFWQTEWFDHWSRSADETDRMVDYIRRNPVKAGLVTHWRDWPHGSWSNVAHVGCPP